MVDFSLTTRKDSISVKELFEKHKELFQTNLISKKCLLDNNIKSSRIHFPGLALSGFYHHFHSDKLQFIADMEWHYLNSLTPRQRSVTLNKFFKHNIPAIIITHNREPHKELIFCAEKFRTPIFQTPLSAEVINDKVTTILEDYFSPKTTIHSSLVDVYGIGLLYTGRSGIGKSECVLDLIERGHRLVADDIITITKSDNKLIGKGNPLLGHHMEIRGIGIIDIKTLFGIRSIRLSKTIEVVIELVDWDPKRNFERLGLSDSTTDIMGVDIKKVVIPIFPGKNITVISEVIAMNVLLSYNGVNTAQDFSSRLTSALAAKNSKRATIDKLRS